VSAPTSPPPVGGRSRPGRAVAGLLPLVERRALGRAVRLLDLDRRRLLGAVVAGSASLASGVALTAAAAWLIARASQMPPVLTLSVAAVSVRLFGISRAVLRYVERLASHDVALQGMAALRTNVYTALANGHPAAVTALRRGDLLARTGADVDAVGDVVVRALVPAAVAAVVALGSVALVGWQLPAAGALLAACLLLAGVVGPVLSMRGARRSEQAQRYARAEISATAMTMVDGAGELTVSGRVGPMIAALRRTEVALSRATGAAARPVALAAGIDTVAMGIAVLGALALGVPATVAGTLPPVALAVIVLTPLAAFEGTALLGPAALQLVRSAGAAVRIMALVDAAGAGADAGAGAGDQPRDRPAKPAPISPAPLLRARDLGVGWPGRPVLAAGIDLDLAPGRAIAIVGASGTGKTTMLLTLAGLLPAAAGGVWMAGRPLWGEPRRWVSGTVVLTTEDAHIFETTVLENLRVARGDLTAAQASELLVRAELGPWLTALPQGLDTVLGSNAATVSGGERRRLLLARALASRAPLLLVDEPGEHLDGAVADRLVLELLGAAHPRPDRVGAGPDPRGVVLVTHRLAALAAADEVILLGPLPQHDRTRTGPDRSPAPDPARQPTCTPARRRPGASPPRRPSDRRSDLGHRAGR
jgi:ATP-binding cassette subfamily C protein CydC